MLSAAYMAEMPPPYMDEAPPPYEAPGLVPIAPAAVVVPIIPPIAIAQGAPPVINNVAAPNFIYIIRNISDLNSRLFTLNKHHSYRYWLSINMSPLQPLTKLTINYCDIGHLYSWDINFPKKRKKYKRIKVYQIGGYNLLKSRLPNDLLDISIYSICLL